MSAYSEAFQNDSRKRTRPRDFNPLPTPLEAQQNIRIVSEIEYRGYILQRGGDHWLWHITDKYHQETTGLHGWYTKPSVAIEAIDNFLKDKEIKDERTTTSNQTSS